MPVDPLVVRRRLRALERYLRTLRELRRLGREAFTGDPAVQDRVERNAELLAQVCADIALHVVSASDAETVPESYGDAIRALGRIVDLPDAVTARLAAAVRLRDLLVHMYLDVDHGRLFDELDWIDDAETLAAAVARWLESLEPE